MLVYFVARCGISTSRLCRLCWITIPSLLALLSACRLQQCSIVHGSSL